MSRKLILNWYRCWKKRNKIWRTRQLCINLTDDTGTPNLKKKSLVKKKQFINLLEKFCSNKQRFWWFFFSCTLVYSWISKKISITHFYIRTSCWRDGMLDSNKTFSLLQDNGRFNKTDVQILQARTVKKNQQIVNPIGTVDVDFFRLPTGKYYCKCMVAYNA